MMTNAEFIKLVSDYLNGSKLSPSKFGRLTIGDPHLVKDITEKGRELREKNRCRVLEFIRNNPVDATQIH